MKTTNDNQILLDYASETTIIGQKVISLPTPIGDSFFEPEKVNFNKNKHLLHLLVKRIKTDESYIEFATQSGGVGRRVKVEHKIVEG